MSLSAPKCKFRPKDLIENQTMWAPWRVGDLVSISYLLLAYDSGCGLRGEWVGRPYVET